MKKIANSLIVVITAFVLAVGSGCMSSGNKSVADLKLREQIVKGKTTKQEIQTLYGKPETRTDLGADGEEWKYTYVTGSVFGAKGSGLIIRFTPEGIVDRVSEGEKKVGMYK